VCFLTCWTTLSKWIGPQDKTHPPWWYVGTFKYRRTRGVNSVSSVCSLYLGSSVFPLDRFNIQRPVSRCNFFWILPLFLVALETDHNRLQFLIYLYFFRRIPKPAGRPLLRRSLKFISVTRSYSPPPQWLTSCNRHPTSAFEIAPRHQNTLVGRLKSFSSTSFSNRNPWSRSEDKLEYFLHFVVNPSHRNKNIPLRHCLDWIIEIFCI
jgi:hypothetical protein